MSTFHDEKLALFRKHFRFSHHFRKRKLSIVFNAFNPILSVIKNFGFGKPESFNFLRRPNVRLAEILSLQTSLTNRKAIVMFLNVAKQVTKASAPHVTGNPVNAVKFPLDSRFFFQSKLEGELSCKNRLLEY